MREPGVKGRVRGQKLAGDTKERKAWRVMIVLVMKEQGTEKKI